MSKRNKITRENIYNKFNFSPTITLLFIFFLMFILMLQRIKEKTKTLNERVSVWSFKKITLIGVDCFKTLYKTSTASSFNQSFEKPLNFLPAFISSRFQLTLNKGSFPNGCISNSECNFGDRQGKASGLGRFIYFLNAFSLMVTWDWLQKQVNPHRLVW